MKLESWTDGAVGETREALVRDGVPVMLAVRRWSAVGRLALWGEVYRARVNAVDVRRRGAFLDLGLGEARGFVRVDAGGRARTPTGALALVEGQIVRARVRREAVGGKSAVLEVIGSVDGDVGRESTPEQTAPPSAEAEIRDRLDALVEASLAPRVPLPGGGALIVERTAALVAIDVDAGGRGGSGDPERFARALNVEAAHEAARQVRLRGLGGIVAIDFVSMRDPAGRAAVMAALKDAVADDPWGVVVAPMSRFGVVELSRGQLRAPLADIVCDADGRPSAETLALAALRGIERESRVARGRRVILDTGSRVGGWLDGNIIDWRGALAARIGPNWEMRRAPELAPDAWQVSTS
jgi:Ribonuclease G/E